MTDRVGLGDDSALASIDRARVSAPPFWPGTPASADRRDPVKGSGESSWSGDRISSPAPCSGFLSTFSIALDRDAGTQRLYVPRFAHHERRRPPAFLAVRPALRCAQPRRRPSPDGHRHRDRRPDRARNPDCSSTSQLGLAQCETNVMDTNPAPSEGTAGGPSLARGLV